MRKIMLNMGVLSLLSLPMIAEQTDSFTDLLGEATDLATEHKLNEDYLPSVISVLRGSELEALGVRNLGEALDILPGIEMTIDQFGTPTAIVRGHTLPNADVYDKIKLVVDGISINNQLSSAGSFYYSLPINLIERIDVLRGPGSVQYGAGAYFGVVNVITKAHLHTGCNEAGAGFGSEEAYYFSNLTCYEAGKLKIAVDGYIQGDNEMVAVDESYVDYPEDFNRPYEVDGRLQDFAIGAQVDYENWSFQTRFKRKRSGNFYGYEERLESDTDMRRIDTSFYAELAYNLPLSYGEWNFSGGFTRYAYDHSLRRRQAGFHNDDRKFEIFGIPMDEDEIMHTIYSENDYHFEMTFKPTTIPNHDIVLGAGMGVTEVDDNEFSSTLEEFMRENWDALEDESGMTIGELFALYGAEVPDKIDSSLTILDVDFSRIGLPESVLNDTSNPYYEWFQVHDNDKDSPYWPKYDYALDLAFYGYQSDDFLKDDISREYWHLYAYDTYAIHPQVDLTAGIRYDHFSDVGGQTHGSLGVIYRANESWILKMMAGSAYRAPNFSEMYMLLHHGIRPGNEDLESEKAYTYETMAIYMPDHRSRFALNLYYTELIDVIDIEEDDFTVVGFQNASDRYTKGIEFECSYRPGPSYTLLFNATYNDTSYTTPWDEIEQKMPNIASLMLKGGVIWKPTGNLTLGTLVKFYDETEADQDWGSSKDTTVDAHTIINQTATYQFSPDIKAQLIVENLFDWEQRSPSYFWRNEGGKLEDGRNIYLTLHWQY